MTRFRLWRVLLVVGIFLAIVLLPIAWQRYREGRVRRSAQENMQQLGQAIIEHERKKAAPRIEEVEP